MLHERHVMRLLNLIALGNSRARIDEEKMTERRSETMMTTTTITNQASHQFLRTERNRRRADKTVQIHRDTSTPQALTRHRKEQTRPLGKKHTTRAEQQEATPLFPRREGPGTANFHMHTSRGIRRTPQHSLFCDLAFSCLVFNISDAIIIFRIRANRFPETGSTPNERRNIGL